MIILSYLHLITLNVYTDISFRKVFPVKIAENEKKYLIFARSHRTGQWGLIFKNKKRAKMTSCKRSGYKRGDIESFPPRIIM